MQAYPPMHNCLLYLCLSVVCGFYLVFVFSTMLSFSYYHVVKFDIRPMNIKYNITGVFKWSCYIL